MYLYAANTTDGNLHARRLSARPCKFNCHVNLVNRLCNTQFNKQTAMSAYFKAEPSRARESDENEQETATLSLFIVSASFVMWNM